MFNNCSLLAVDCGVLGVSRNSSNAQHDSDEYGVFSGLRFDAGKIM